MLGWVVLALLVLFGWQVVRTVLEGLVMAFQGVRDYGDRRRRRAFYEARMRRRLH